MESFTALANLYSRNSLHDVAYSALPNAPVQTITEPRSRHRWTLARIRRPARQPAIGLRPAHAEY